MLNFGIQNNLTNRLKDNKIYIHKEKNVMKNIEANKKNYQDK